MEAPRSARRRFRPSAGGFALALTLAAAVAIGPTGCGTSTTTAARSTQTNTEPASESATLSADDGNGTTSVAPPTTTAPTTTEQPPTTPAPDERVIPGTPLELAQAFTEAESAVRDETLDPATRASWAKRQQWLYRVLSANPAWAEAALAAVDPAHAGAVALNWEARLALDALLDTSRLSETLPAWRIEPPAPADELIGYYREAADQTGVPWEILAAINLIETRMGRINGISTAGALGPMQFLPSTWQDCCEGDPTDDRDAIIGAATYLIDRGALTDLDRAIYGYNNSDHYVRAVRSYAEVMAQDPAAYYGFHAWEVYFLSTEGLVLLPVGYEEPVAVDAATWLAANPDNLVDLNSAGATSSG